MGVPTASNVSGWDEESGREPGARPPGPEPLGTLAAQLGTAAWFGLAAGLVELAVLLGRIELAQAGLYRRNRHLVWMIPLANLVILGLCGLTIGLPARATGSRLGRKFSGFVLCVLAFLAPLLALPGLRAASCLIFALGLACWVVPLIEARAEGFGRLVRQTLPALGLFVLGLAAVAFGRDQLAERRAAAGRPAPPAGAPNVLLVVMDTVCADAMSLHGYSRATTPHLAALAERGVCFERAIASAPWTLPSHASLFTGRSAAELAVGSDRPLDGRFPTLAEALSRLGYATGGFVANTFYCSAEFGLNRGFAHYEDYVVSPLEVLRSSSLGWLIYKRMGIALDHLYPALGLRSRHPLELDFYRKDAARINRDALRWIARRGDRPFFAFLNYMDAHDPYLVPSGVRERFGNLPASPAELQTLRQWSLLARQPQRCRPGDLALARNAYDECLAYLDDQLNRLFTELDRLGELKRTLIVVTADHGEHFGEHQLDGKLLVSHGASLYQPEIHVPLLIIKPGKVPAGTVIGTPVSLRNLPATVFDLIGVNPTSRPGVPKFPGTSLARAWRGSRPPRDRTASTSPSTSTADPDDASASPGEPESESEPVLSELVSRDDRPANRPDAPDEVLRAVVSGSQVYHRIGRDREELYDLRSDPAETHNLAGDRASRPALDRFRHTLARLAPARPAKPARGR
jgi:arylsulfatase A-like enzyme